MSGPDDAPFAPATLCAQAGFAHDDAGGVVPPIRPATTYVRDAAYALPERGFYLRYGGPNFADAEALIAALERAAEALTFASGLAASDAVLRALPQAAHVVMQSRAYFGIVAQAREAAARGAIRLTEFDPREADALGRAIRPGETKLVWIETPANPTWDIVDIAAAAAHARSAGALLAVDSTSATPILTRPLALGADIVMHAATKYLNGHSDVLGGALAVADPALPVWAEVKAIRKLGGAVMGPFEAWLLLRGLRTLDLRVRRQCETALALAERLAAHPAVEAVLYPGLASHPQHAVARAQMQGGFGGMLSVVVKGGEGAALRMATATRLFKPATSLGGVESLIEHRKTVEGAASDVPPGLLRLSVGIEDPDDLWRDLARALERAAG